jgi:dTDP-glucose 4,6-dehydratase
MTILVTGGAGFIGSNFAARWCAASDEPIVNLDALTYAGNRHNLRSLENNPRHQFVHGDIRDGALVAQLLREHHVRAMVHFAAESHVDRSLAAPGEFVDTNIVGTFRLLEAAQNYLAETPRDFRFLHVSTDEVYGTLAPDAPAFTEATPYAPNSPYAASKAASDHLVRSYFHSYGVPTLTSHCSNNFGPYQFPEKLIPLCITRALAGQKLPIYGDGLQVRDWLYVHDHCDALMQILEKGSPGETYNVGAHAEKTNLALVQNLCAILDRVSPRSDGAAYAEQIAFVADRPGHDRRYAINAGKLQRELGWKPATPFDAALEATVAWYLQHSDWLANITSGEYRHWVAQHYGT